MVIILKIPKENISILIKIGFIENYSIETPHILHKHPRHHLMQTISILEVHRILLLILFKINGSIEIEKNCANNNVAKRTRSSMDTSITYY